MRVQVTLNRKEFIIIVVCNTKENDLKPGYICESDLDSEICSSASEVINEIWKKHLMKVHVSLDQMF